MINDYLISHFSYSILFIWSIFEGEIGLALAGFLSKNGHFIFENIIFIAITGALIGDISLFLFGKIFSQKAQKWLTRYSIKITSIEKWFNKNAPLLIIFERFIYGTHIPSLLLISLSGYSFFKFLIADIIGVTLWALTFTTLGYYFGHNVIDMILLAQRHISLVLLLLFAILLIILNKKSS